MSREDLPSVDDFAEDNSNLPSVDDFIVEEVEEELPSVEDFIEKEEIEEGTQTIEDLNGETFAEVEDIVPPWPELVRLINDVRADIPDIPEIKYYDKELEQLAEQISQVRDEIPEVPEVRYYEREVEAICEQIDLVRSEIKDLPEVKYYDEQVDQIEDRIDTLQTEVANLPEVKYYDAEIKAICEAIDAVKESIPKFPKWVNEVNEVPDFSWIGKTFSVIDDDFIKVNDHIDTLRERVDYNLKELSEDIDKKKFEAKVELDTKSEEIEAKIKEEKDKIWKEMRESSLRIWEYHKEFKDDDRKLKKQILGEYNSLKKSIDKKVNEFNENSVKTDKLLLDYFEDLRNEISSLPEVKYYDDDIRHVKTDIKELFKLVMTIKTEQKEIKDLQEGLLNEPPSEKEDVGSGADPLTPMDQKFATLDDLSSHYRLFINRIQQQIATIGGGGAGFIKDLDDVSFDQTTGTDQLLIYNGSQWVGIASTAISGAPSELADICVGTNLTVENLSVTGIATYEDVRNVDSIGFITARSGIEVTAGIVTTPKLHVGVGTTFTEDLVVSGDARVTGILTIGTGSITLDPNARRIKGIDEILIGADDKPVTIKKDDKGEIKFEDNDGKETSVGIGTTVSINTSGIITAATIKASTAFYPPLYTTSARDAGTFTQGAIIFNTTTSKLEFYDGTSWQSLPGMSLGLTVALDG